MESIRDKIGDTTCHVLSGNFLWEKTLWVMQCHAHVSIYGAGTIFPLIAGIPGVLLAGSKYHGYIFVLEETRMRDENKNKFDEFLYLPGAYIRDEMGDNPRTRGFYVDAPRLADFLDDRVLGRLARPSSNS